MLRTIVDFGTRDIFGLAVPLRIYGYGLMLVCGFISGICLARWRAKRAGENPDNMTQCCILALVGGVVGARIAFVIEKYDTEFAQSGLVEIMNITSGGLIYYGGVLLAMALVVAYLRMKGLPIRRYLDILAASMMIGLAFGRAGCLLNGCCSGTTSSGDWPLAMKFPMFSQPLIKVGKAAGPFSVSMDAPCPVYSEQLKDRAVHLYERGERDGPDYLAFSGDVLGHISPDPRLVHQFSTSRVMIEKGGKEVELQGLLLHPPKYLHGPLKSDQLATMFAERAEAREQFEALAADGRLDYEEWCGGLEDGRGFLRGSEHWDEALSSDGNRDKLLSFDEAWQYLQKRRARLALMFPAKSSATGPGAGAGSTTARGGINLAGANAYLQEDLFALAARSHSLPVKPAQILGIINALLLAAILTSFHRLRSREGQVFALMLILYPITRFLLEMIRTHNQDALLGGVLTHNQWTSLATIVTGVIFWGILCKLPGPIAD